MNNCKNLNYSQNIHVLINSTWYNFQSILSIFLGFFCERPTVLNILINSFIQNTNSYWVS